jgi:hypothetical protein
MITTLDELAQYIRKTIPNPKAILNLQPKNAMGAVTFYWHGVEFLVKPTLQVMEIRGNNLYITGLSTLLQVVLLRSNQDEKGIESALASINEAEDLIRVKNQPKAGAKLLQVAVDTLKRVIGKRG